MGDDATWLIMVERSLFTRPELTQQVVYIIVTLHGNGAYIKVEVTDRLKTVVTVALLYSKRITVFQFFESLLNMGKLDFNSTFSVCNSSTCTTWFRINMVH